MNTFELGSETVMNTYNRFPIVLEKGDGMYVYDDNGKKYLDFVAGIAVNSLGHNHKKLTETIADQAKTLIHCSNLYYTKPQISLASKLVKNSDFDKVFFCNSGAEAIEAALKVSRKYGSKTNRYEIITMKNSFHGRTFGAVTATGQPHYQEGLGELLPGIKYAEFNNFESLTKVLTDKTCAVLLEPLQGEGGIHPAEKEYLEKIRKLCDENDIMLIFDEVQCGVGRLGTLFAYQTFKVKPDAVCTAKGIAGGVPMGLMAATDKLAESFKPGDHASTFGGNPLAAAAGNVVVDELLGGLLENVRKNSSYLTEKLNFLKAKYPIITDVRGIGYMQGIELSITVSDIIKRTIENGLLLVNAGKNVIRFVPSLIAEKEHIDEGINILDSVLSEF
ncbi:MAG: aspartate aminotransferase family protein [Clostridiales bacterium]|nr:aspartate aminotransferase family protein [Clostridiales bacterium]